MGSNPKVSVCIACHNQGHLIGEAVVSCLQQDYSNLEIVVLDDASTDNLRASWIFTFPHVKYFRSDSPSGTGGAFNKAIAQATGDIIVLLCADDLFTDRRVISDIVQVFQKNPHVGHVSRYYHQFVDGDRHPVRAWRCDDVMELANNPSGLAFRREIFEACRMFTLKDEAIDDINNPVFKEPTAILSNKMFVEAAHLVAQVLLQSWGWHIMPWDTVAVRIHQSISQSKDYYLKRWTSSPVEEWAKVGGTALLKDYTSLIQIKNNFKTSAVLRECWNFIRLRPINALMPAFWFFAFVGVFTPRPILRQIPNLYRRTWGRWTTHAITRP